MSLDHYKEAARNRIRAALSYPNESCEVMTDGRPSARAGIWFVAIHGGQETQEQDNSLYERSSFTVTITRRAGQQPRDRQGQKLTDADEIRRRAAAIRLILHMDYTTMNNANTALYAATAASVGGYVEPVRLISVDGSPREVGSDWFTSRQGTNVGLVLNLQFGRALRIQTLGSAS